MKRTKSKIRVGVIFGGQSAEHEVSLVSATSIIRALDPKKYEVISIGIAPTGKWYSFPGVLDRMKSKASLKRWSENILLPDPTVSGLTEIEKSGSAPGRAGVDVLFSVVHGTFGEDGCLQGLFELANIPYVGAGVLGSSVGMDKVLTKQVCDWYGIPVTPFLWFFKKEFKANPHSIVVKIEKEIGYPCFVKPANSGSSVGISKAKNRKQLKIAIALAIKYDRKILVEQGIDDAREIEVSVLGNDDPAVSVPGEIISSNEFYDYNAKYVDGKSKDVIPADIPPAVRRIIQSLAVQTFQAIECSGMARVDFLVTKKTNRIYLNEINTIPGFTSISMYPKLWEASGIPYPKLLERLIDLAFQRFDEKSALIRTYSPKREWFKSS
jgi:D-alanine-D-alanine ligase